MNNTAICRKCIHYNICSYSTVLEKEIKCKDFICKADVAEVKHGKWEAYEEHEDGYVHHRCSVCKEDAIFNYEEESGYDEEIDGEWYYIGDITVGISEQLSPYCPNCGAKMDKE